MRAKARMLDLSGVKGVHAVLARDAIRMG